MIVKILGCRGSIPSTGMEFSHFGGNTASIQVIAEGGEYILLDAGTGIRNAVDYAFKSEFREIGLFLTHFHWDHILGMPFFTPFYVDEFKFNIYGPKKTGEEIYKTINGILQPDYFPIQLEQFKSSLEFHGFSEGTIVNMNGFKVEGMWTNHPAFTLAYKVTKNGKSLVYMTDHEPYEKFLHPLNESIAQYKNNTEKLTNRVNNFIKDADLLIIDAEYKEEEYCNIAGWGHSTVNDVLKLTANSNIKKVLFFHHNQNRTDNALEEMIHNLSKLPNFNKNINYSFAEENKEIHL